VVNVLNSAREILDSSKQQSSAIGQINVAVQQLDRDTQSMSATAEESAAAAAELDAQAGSLNGIVHVLGELVSGRDESSGLLPNPAYSASAHAGHTSQAASRNVTQFRKPQAKGRAVNGKASGAREPAAYAPPLVGNKAVGSDTWEEI